MTWLDVTTSLFAASEIAGGALGIYIMLLRWRGRPAPRWLPWADRLIRPDKRRLDRALAALVFGIIVREK